jgi:hypothetical protein
MAYFYTLADQHMNCALNRPLADGEAKARVAEAKALPPRSRTLTRGPRHFSVRCGREFSSSMPGKNLQRLSWIISRLTKPFGLGRRAVAILRFVQPRWSRESSKSSRCPRPTGVWT